LLTWPGGCIYFVHTGSIFPAILAFLSVGAEWGRGEAGIEKSFFLFSKCQGTIGALSFLLGMSQSKVILD
jgi:hypothetical protein